MPQAWGDVVPEGVDPASRRLGQGERQAPRRGCLRPAPQAASGRSLFSSAVGFSTAGGVKSFS